jgi:hypothetical protein
MRFQTRFAFDLGQGRSSECEIEVEKSEAGRIQVTLCESGLRGGELVRSRYARISNQVYGKFLKGIPARRIRWAYRSDSVSEIPLKWDGARLYLHSGLNSGASSGNGRAQSLHA